jgi:hypothetical protein
MLPVLSPLPPNPFSLLKNHGRGGGVKKICFASIALYSVWIFYLVKEGREKEMKTQHSEGKPKGTEAQERCQRDRERDRKQNKK